MKIQNSDGLSSHRAAIHVNKFETEFTKGNASRDTALRCLRALFATKHNFLAFLSPAGIFRLTDLITVFRNALEPTEELFRVLIKIYCILPHLGMADSFEVSNLPYPVTPKTRLPGVSASLPGCGWTAAIACSFGCIAEILWEKFSTLASRAEKTQRSARYSHHHNFPI